MVEQMGFKDILGAMIEKRVVSVPEIASFLGVPEAKVEQKVSQLFEHGYVTGGAKNIYGNLSVTQSGRNYWKTL